MDNVVLEPNQLIGGILAVFGGTMLICSLVRLWWGHRKAKQRERDKFLDLIREHDATLYGRNQYHFQPKHNEKYGLLYRLERLERDHGIEPPKEEIW